MRWRWERAVIALCALLFICLFMLMRSNRDYDVTEPYSLLVDESFKDGTVIQLATFNTSMATLTVADIAFRNRFNRSKLHINRRMYNGDRIEIYITELALRVPPNVGSSNSINTASLSVDYNQLQLPVRPVAAPPFATGSVSTDSDAKSDVLIIGLGGSQINNFLHHRFPNMNLTVVELEPTMVEAARQFFGLQEDETQRVVVMDGLEYLKDAVERGMKYDAIIIDVCPTRFSREVEVMCPIPVFLDDANIELLRMALRDTGTLSIKMLLFTPDVDRLAEDIADKYRKHFANCAITPMMAMPNRVTVCSGEGIPKERLQLESLIGNAERFFADLGLDPY